jgi:isoleucyl-tRNA synthetase
MSPTHIFWRGPPRHGTFISNLGLSVGRNIDYVKVTDSSDGASYILAEARLKDYFKNEEEYKIVWTKKGVDLGGLTYEPLSRTSRKWPAREHSRCLSETMSPPKTVRNRPYGTRVR